jgi:molybdate transport system substrate-binding protein
VKRCAIATIVILALAGCSAPAPASAPSPSTDPIASSTLVVHAAASLTDAFTQLGAQFESAHPGAKVTFNFGGSSALATQITGGGPGDVFAAASATTMALVSDAKLTDRSPTIFATNTLELVVPKGNPANITGLADLARADLKIALCATAVPCGAAAATLLSLDGIAAKPDTLEQDVKAVLTKVELGEVDAALVYRTDVLAASGKVEGIDVPDASKVVNSYPIAALTSSTRPAAARAFVAFVLSAEGQAVLAKWGFGQP